jgi:hypothetical protein
MRYHALSAVAALLACSGCVVHQVPVATPVSAAAPVQETQNCREFQDTVTVGGTKQRAYGTTCQQADGSWKIVAPPGSTEQQAAPAAVPAYPAYAYPAYPYPAYPYYGYPAYYGPTVGVGFRFSGHWH